MTGGLVYCYREEREKVGRKKERKSRIVSIGVLKLVRSRKEAVNISEVEERGSCALTVCVNVPVQSMNIHNKEMGKATRVAFINHPLGMDGQK